MFNWDQYAGDVLAAYGVAISMIIVMIVIILIQSARAKRRLDAAKRDG